MRQRRRRDFLGGAVREVVFGLEDSLVSTLGAVAGVSIGSGDRGVVILAGLVLVTVEAISMAAGSFLSTESAQQVSKERHAQDSARILQERVSDDESIEALFQRKGFSKNEITSALDALKRERHIWLKEITRVERRLFTAGIHPTFAALVMGITYFFGGAVTLLPYFFLPVGAATLVAFFIAICLLFFVGVWKARIAGLSQLRSGAEMVAVSLFAAAIGMAVGRIAAMSLGVQT